MSEIEHVPDPTAHELMLAGITEESALREAMLDQCRTALAREGGKVKMGQGRYHITDQALTEMAGHLHVSIDVEQGAEGIDPLTDKPMAVCKVRATRSDGVYAEAVGYCSTGEEITRQDGSKFKRWTEWHAARSMAETRARVRALTVLFKAVVTMADSSVDVTPGETMPGDYVTAEACPANGGGSSGRARSSSRGSKRPTREARFEALWARLQAWPENYGYESGQLLKAMAAEKDISLVKPDLAKATHVRLDKLEALLDEVAEFDAGDVQAMLEEIEETNSAVGIGSDGGGRAEYVEDHEPY